MGIRQKGDNWYIDYYVNNKRKREKVGPSKKLAELALKKRKIEIAENKFLDIKKSNNIQFEDVGGEFLSLHSRVNKKPSSSLRDKSLIDNLNSYFGRMKLCDITPKSIEQYKRLRLETMAPATVNRELACMKCIFNKAIEWGKATENPARRVKMLKENNQRLRYLEKEEIEKLIDNSPEFLKPIVIVAVFTGMRKGEIINLKWQDIDLSKGIVYLQDSKIGKREVYLNNNVKNMLIHIKKHSESPYVFCNKNGNTYSKILTTFYKATEKSGIKNFRFHDLRHTYASHLTMSGVDLRTVQELMGHKTIEMTLRYSHLSPDHKRQAIEVLDKKLDVFWTPRENAIVKGDLVYSHK